MFNHKYQVRPAFFLDPKALKRRLVLCGVAHALFMPFLVFFMLLHFAMNNVYDWKSTKQYMGPKDWTLIAKWTFREFNELPHFFEKRLGPSYEAADDYLKLFTQSEIMTTIGRILAFIGGSFGGILLVFAAVNDAILLHVKIGQWNLLWYVGVMGVVYSAGKSMLPNPEAHPRYIRNLFAEMDSALEKVSTHTHHFPDIWRGRGWDKNTKNIISSMFNNKANIFFEELVALMLAPIILCISLPRCAESICEFVMTSKTSVGGTGDVCGYGTFDFDCFGDENFEGRTLGGDQTMAGSVSASVHQLNDVEAAVRRHPKPRMRHGKMEKSFFSFKGCHPSWRSTKSGQHLLDRVENFKTEETFALMREQQLHVQAAARQIETLEMLEQSEKKGPVHQIHEAYIGQSSMHQHATGYAPPTIADASSHSMAEQGTLKNSLSSGKGDQAVSPKNEDRGRLPATKTDNFSPLGQRLPSTNALHYADAGLSTELRSVLNRSTLDPGMSASGVFGRSSVVSLGGAHGQLASLIEDAESEESEGRTQQQVSQKVDSSDTELCSYYFFAANIVTVSMAPKVPLKK